MNADSTVNRLFERYVEHHVTTGERLESERLCRERPELAAALRQLIDRYHELDATLLAGPAMTAAERPADPSEPAPSKLPRLGAFETIEKIGAGGMGEVYKARDPLLGRIVAIKRLRSDSPLAAAYGDFLGEAKSLALFSDPRIVQIHEFRPDSEPPLIVMEFVEGFRLDQIGSSLEFGQRARIVLEICEALQHAHERGIQHRDLKPANLMLDAKLSPKILDFGLSSGSPRTGHFVGTPPYLAPEQLDPARPLDERTDIYALGVVFYELLCGSQPPMAESPASPLAERLPLPIELDAGVPEPLQAIALKAMERDPIQRYASAQEMARDLRRYLEGRPVLARPTLYASALAQRLRPHLQHIEEWKRLKLIYPHEASRLKSAYSRLESREDDWIVESRVLSFSQITLYLGAFLLLCGGLLYFAAHRVYEAAVRLFEPALVLGVPLVGLNVAARWLDRREHRAVSVAFYLAGILLLPLFLLVFFHDAGLFTAAPQAAGQLFGEVVSNRQLQAASLLALGWSVWLSLRSRTIGLSSASTLLLTIAALSVLADLGLDEWIEQGRWDLLALHLAPLAGLEALLAYGLERCERPFLSRPLYAGTALTGMIVLELFALDGRAFAHLGLSMARFQAEQVANPVLLDTLTAMTINGILIYLAAWIVERYGTELMRWASVLLAIVSPFAILEPAAYLVQTGDYSRRYDWLYLGLALAIALLSQYRQRKSFYFAGLINTGLALFLITHHQEWFDEPAWGMAVIGVGLAVLGAGHVLYLKERDRRRIDGNVR